MQLDINSSVSTKYPDLKLAYMTIRNASNKRIDDKLEQAKRDLEAYVRKHAGNYENHPHIELYQQFYKKYKAKYPVKYQIQSVLAGKSLPTRSTLVEAMFIAELQNVYLTAGHDLNQIRGSLTTKLTLGTETYIKINNQTQQLKIADIVTCDEVGIISSVLYGPDSRTRITETTKDCLFFSYFPYGEKDEKIINHFDCILNNIKLFSDSKLDYSEVEIYKT